MAQRRDGSPPFQCKNRTRKAENTGWWGLGAHFNNSLYCWIGYQDTMWQKFKEKNIQSQQGFTTRQYFVLGYFVSKHFHLKYNFHGDNNIHNENPVMQYIVQIQEDSFCCRQPQPKVLSMQIHVHGSVASIYLYMHQCKLRGEFLLTKNLNFKIKKKIVLAILWPAGDCFITRPFFSPPLNIIYWSFT